MPHAYCVLALTEVEGACLIKLRSSLSLPTSPHISLRLPTSPYISQDAATEAQMRAMGLNVPHAYCVLALTEVRGRGRGRVRVRIGVRS